MKNITDLREAQIEKIGFEFGETTVMFGKMALAYKDFVLKMAAELKNNKKMLKEYESLIKKLETIENDYLQM